jgi:hypothetical protein
MYASFLRISRALHLDVFEQPAENHFFNNLLDDVENEDEEVGKCHDGMFGDVVLSPGGFPG